MNENEQCSNKIIISAVNKDHHSIFDIDIFVDVEFPTCPCVGDKITITGLGKDNCSYRVVDKEFILFGVDKSFDYIQLYLEKE
jgi:hypothetical protein